MIRLLVDSAKGSYRLTFSQSLSLDVLFFGFIYGYNNLSFPLVRRVHKVPANYLLIR